MNWSVKDGDLRRNTESGGKGSPGRKRQRQVVWTKRTRANFRTGMLFLSPWLIGFLAFTLYPMVISLYYSFTIYHSKRAPDWVGLQNYSNLLTDDKFWISLTNTLYMVIIAVPLGLLASFLCAILLNLKVRGQAFYRVVYFLPSIVPTVAGTILFLWLLNPQVGLVNSLLARIGIDGPNWMADPELVQACADPARLVGDRRHHRHLPVRLAGCLCHASSRPPSWTAPTGCSGCGTSPSRWCRRSRSST